jgi:hypothetical protein
MTIVIYTDAGCATGCHLFLPSVYALSVKLAKDKASQDIKSALLHAVRQPSKVELMWREELGRLHACTEVSGTGCHDGACTTKGQIEQTGTHALDLSADK